MGKIFGKSKNKKPSGNGEVIEMEVFEHDQATEAKYRAAIKSLTDEMRKLRNKEAFLAVASVCRQAIKLLKHDTSLTPAEKQEVFDAVVVMTELLKNNNPQTLRACMDTAEKLKNSKSASLQELGTTLQIASGVLLLLGIIMVLSVATAGVPMLIAGIGSILVLTGVTTLFFGTSCEDKAIKLGGGRHELGVRLFSAGEVFSKFSKDPADSELQCVTTPAIS